MNNTALEPNQDYVNSCSHIYKLVSGDVVFIRQHDHYTLSIDLSEYLCLYEYCRMIKVVNKPRPPTAYAADGGRRRGRAENLCFDFHPTHKLFATYHQQLCYNFFFPILAGSNPPSFPGNREGTIERERSAKRFGHYMLTFLVLYSYDILPAPHSFCYEMFCMWS